MFIIYDLIALIFTFIYLPAYLFKRKFHRGFSARLGILPARPPLEGPIWIHAVSVGEAMAVKGLIEELRKAYPEKKFVISTVTATGNKIARAIAAKSDLVTYLPLDFSFIVKKAIDKINPSLFILAETEIWPNLISYLWKRKIPVITVNGRISDSSFRGYLSARFLFKPLLRKVSLFCVQAGRDAQRLERLGVAADKIHVTGNMKFDLPAYPDKEMEDFRQERRSILGLIQKESLFVAGSTHPGEETAILSIYKELLGRFGGLRLLLAPRHPERSREITRAALSFGFAPVLISALPSACPAGSAPPVFILDTVGQLISYYAAGDIVFVGGSLVKKGGHNILEPASLARPVIFGPYMFNFQDIADLFLSRRAAIRVNNPEELKVNIARLLANPQEAVELGRRGQALIQENRGATQRNLQYLERFTPHGP